MLRIISFTRAATALAALLAFAVPDADAATRFVSTCGNNAWTGFNVNCIAPHGPKRTIQAAINASVDGDVINVMPGAYLETIDLDGKAITIVGLAGAATTIIDGNGSGPVVTCNSFEGLDTVLQGLTIRDGVTPQSGGGMLIALASPTIISCVFDENRAWVSGGAIAITAGSPSIIDCTFTQNEAESPNQDSQIGGAIHMIGGSPDIIGCDFTANVGWRSGGAISMASNATPTIEECTFTANAQYGQIEPPPAGTVPLMGGAVLVNSSNPTFDDCDFIGNGGAGRGAAVGCWGGDVTFTGCTFDGNIPILVPIALGGALAAYNNAEISMVGCQFMDNVGNFDGGAIFSHQSTVSAALCGFQNNTAGSRGGAIYLHLSDFTLSGCTLTSNDADGEGGAIKSLNSDLVLEACVFSSNTAGSRGGAVDTQTGTLAATRCTFSSNNSTSVGGEYGGGAIGIYGFGAQTTALTGCTFENNQAYNGGGVRVEHGVVTIDDCTFEGNHADFGGGGVSSVSTEIVTMRDSQFIDNDADGIGGGATISQQGRVVGCQFQGNSAARGGGLATHYMTATRWVIGCRFTGNTASEHGGALFQQGTAPVRVVNCVLDGNIAPVGAGTIAEADGSGTIQLINCLVTGNQGGGVHIDDPTVGLRVVNSVLWGNSNGGSFNGDAPSAVMFSNVQGGYAGTGNINVAPMFVNAAVGNYAPAAGSPVIDAGSNWAMTNDALDLDGDGDTAELTPFDFAGNPRITDNAMLNIACGGGARIDIGPIESPGAASPSLTPGDVNGDGIINVTDLLAVIGAWGPCPAGACCAADFNLDGQINVTDLLTVIANWG